MLSLQSLFARRQTTQAAVSAQQPTVLSADALKLVGGGLPRVSYENPTVNAVAEAPLPRVS